MHAGRGILNNFINKLPFELHVPGYQYCGPGTKLAERLARGDPGINPLDAACKEHDIAYSRNRDNVAARNSADGVLAEKAWRRVLAKDAGIDERLTAYTVANTMKVKSKLGMGVARRRRRMCGRGSMKRRPDVSLNKIIRAAARSSGGNSSEIIRSALVKAREAVKQAGGRRKVIVPRVLPVARKVGGVLPFLIPLFAGLSATGALVGGAAGVAKAVNTAKAAERQLRENHRHNETMEAIALGKGLYLKPHKTGFGVHVEGLGGGKKKKKAQLPKRPLTDVDLVKYAQDIPHFRGVFMRNDLPRSGPHYRESAIINLDDKEGRGTHWVAYRKRGRATTYFDSFGDLRPPRELMEYLGVRSEVKYNHTRYQDFDTYECGHLCLKFLYNQL